jgi:micrococcal nuclease
VFPGAGAFSFLRCRVQNFQTRPFLRLCRLQAALCTLAAVAMLAAAGAAAIAQEAATCPELEPGPARTVARVVDGETLALDDGSEVRLIGALPPRALDAGLEPGAWPIEAAATEALRSLVLGKSIELAFGGERVDRYGRLQAHGLLIEGEQRRWVQGHLLAQGLARAYLQAGNRVCAKELAAAEQAAREARRGLWLEAAYQPRDADDAAGLLRYHARFQVVEGRIVRAAQVRGLVYLSFGGHRRQAFYALLRIEDRAVLGEYAANPKGLEGRMVRVRGWIERRGNTPTINLSSAGLIEVLDTGSSDGGRAR